MSYLFFQAAVFNQDIADWNVSTDVNMTQMFDLGLSDTNKGLIHASFSKNENWPYDWSAQVAEVPALTDETFSTALALWFSDEAAAIETYGHIRNWNTSAVTNMREAFKDKAEFNENISNWDTSSVTNMSKMFNNAKAFNQPIGKWDTSSLKSVNYIFANAEKFNQPLANWDVSQVSHMTAMFYNAFEFDQDISAWDTSNLQNMDQMFYGATAFNQPIGGWNTSKVTTMSTFGWPHPSIKTSASGIRRKSSLHELHVQRRDCFRSTHWRFMGYILGHQYMFQQSHRFNRDISHWDTSKVTFMNWYVSARAFNRWSFCWRHQQGTYSAFSLGYRLVGVRAVPQSTKGSSTGYATNPSGEAGALVGLTLRGFHDGSWFTEGCGTLWRSFRRGL